MGVGAGVGAGVDEDEDEDEDELLTHPPPSSIAWREAPADVPSATKRDSRMEGFS